MAFLTTETWVHAIAPRALRWLAALPAVLFVLLLWFGVRPVFQLVLAADPAHFRRETLVGILAVLILLGFLAIGVVGMTHTMLTTVVRWRDQDK